MCGITGIISDSNINLLLYESLFHLQHRGQSSTGFTIINNNNNIISTKEFEFKKIKNMNNLEGNIGIGHVRYKTSGNLSINEIQPFIIDNIALCHNGNISNYEKLYNEYKDYIEINSKSDSELFLKIFNYELNILNCKILNDSLIVNTIKKISDKCNGAYSIIIMIKNYGLICFKDPYGIRPLIYGKRNNSYVISSESCSIKNIDFDLIGDIKGGEIIIFKNDISISKYIYSIKIQKPCLFEWIYIARDDSIINNVSVYESRLKMGEYLAKKIKFEINIDDIDFIIPIPDTSRPSALKISEILNIPYREGIIKNRYIGRTFIMDNQNDRKKNLKRKLNVIEKYISNKNIILVDDSIVRGNTIKHIINLLYKNNVKNITVVSCAPIIRYQNFYGIDIPTKNELISNNMSLNEIEKKLNIKKIIYLSIEEICKSITDLNANIKDFELSVFNGKYIN